MLDAPRKPSDLSLAGCPLAFGLLLWQSLYGDQALFRKPAPNEPSPNASQIHLKAHESYFLFSYKLAPISSCQSFTEQTEHGHGKSRRSSCAGCRKPRGSALADAVGLRVVFKMLRQAVSNSQDTTLIPSCSFWTPSKRNTKHPCDLCYGFRVGRGWLLQCVNAWTRPRSTE